MGIKMKDSEYGEVTIRYNGWTTPENGRPGGILPKMPSGHDGASSVSVKNERTLGQHGLSAEAERKSGPETKGPAGSRQEARGGSELSFDREALIKGIKMSVILGQPVSRNRLRAGGKYRG